MSDYLQETAAIVTAFVQNNKVSGDELPDLIASVHSAIASAENSDVDISEAAVEQPSTAAIRKSMGGEKLISFEDGRSYSSLKRHLGALGLTPEQYRAKWGLPASYPMVAPAYSERRSLIAKALGLGSKGRGGKPARKATVRGRAKK